MADPENYAPSYSFVGWQSINPTKPLPGVQVDNELANIAASVDTLVAAVQDIRRSDGALNNDLVTLDSLAPEVTARLGDPGADGWSPQFAVVTDGARRVLQVTGWAGGSGTPPASGLYVGATGLTAVLADAVDVRGPQGVPGAGFGDMLAANNLSDLTNASTARSNLGVAIGSDVQAYDADLTALAGVTSAADKVPYFTGAGTAAVTTFTSAGRSLVAVADAPSARTLLGLGNVDNTSDANKPVSTATATALAAKEATANKGVANGYASLGSDVKVPGSQLVAALTEQATTSGTQFDFTIPAGVKMIFVTIDQASLSGTDIILVQLGDSSGVATSGYAGPSTSGMYVWGGAAANTYSGVVQLLNPSGYKWIGNASSFCSVPAANSAIGIKTLTGALTTVRVTRSGSNTFDAGAVGVIYI